MGPRGFPLSNRERGELGDERGAATVVAAICLVALVSITAGGAYVAAAVVARHRAQAAADLAALTAATVLVRGAEVACGQATDVAARMGAHVAGCTIDELDVVVAVEVNVHLGRFAVGPALASARAGPALSPFREGSRG